MPMLSSKVLRLSRFHLRTLLLFMLVCCAMFAFVGSQRRTHARQVMAANRLQELGFGFQFHDKPFLSLPLQPILGDDSYSRVRRVFGRAKFQSQIGHSDVFILLAELQRVEEVDIRYLRCGPKGMSAISRNRSLKRVDLSYSSVSDADIAIFGNLPHLRDLRLAGTSISDSSVDVIISRMSSLRGLDISLSNITPSGFERLRIAMPATVIVY